MVKRTFRVFGLAMCLCVALSSCGTQARRVDCDGKLEPINRPAVKAAPTSPASDAKSKGTVP